MTTRIRALAALALLAVASTFLVACSAAPGPKTLAILVETFDANHIPTPGRIVAVNIMALNKYGAPGSYRDVNTGEERLYPLVTPVESPWSHPFEPVLPGESGIIELEAILFGPVGESVSCAVFVNGEQVEFDEVRIEPYQNIPGNSVFNQSGSATVRCFYTVSVPLSN